MFARKSIRVSCLVLGLATFVGCAGRPSLVPNSDPALRKTSAQFAADAVKRFPAPTGDVAGALTGRVDIDVQRDTLQIANFTSNDWLDVDVWVNRTHVVHVPRIDAEKDGKPGTRTLDFQMIFNDQGESFPTDNDKYPVNTVEIKMDGKLYSIKQVMD